MTVLYEHLSNSPFTKKKVSIQYPNFTKILVGEMLFGKIFATHYPIIPFTKTHLKKYLVFINKKDIFYGIINVTQELISAFPLEYQFLIGAFLLSSFVVLIMTEPSSFPFQIR